ncbi:MAG TPA: hypothetical protein VEY71_04810 [Chitinophagales bacterium]|nr:hypothetical protein [Chitinophagales bacterium]
MVIRFFNTSIALATVVLLFSACATNTDDATNSSGTEKHGTMDQQVDSLQAEQGPGLQPRDTVTTTGP